MGRKGFKKPKDPYASISKTWRDAVDGMNREEVQARVVTTTLDNNKLEEAKKNDEDLKAALERAKFAGEVYRTGAKEFKLKVRYLQKRLDDLGGSTGAVAKDEAKATAEDIKKAADKFNGQHRAS